MAQTQRRKPYHCYIFKCEWRATALRLRIEADDLEYAYKRAENMVKRMFGGFMCLSIECVQEVY